MKFKRESLEELNHELIKAHVLDPAHSPLTKDQSELFDRLVAAAKVSDRYPNLKCAVAIHRTNFPEIGRTQAYADFSQASRLFHTLHTFDFSFWQSWMLNEIATNIMTCKKTNTSESRRIIAMEHANMIEVLGAKPNKLPDPGRTEDHQFFIMIQNGYRQIPVDINRLAELPLATIKEINRAILGGKGK